MEIGIAFVQQISYTVPVENPSELKHEVLWAQKFLWWNMMPKAPILPPMPITAQRCPWIRPRQNLKG